MITDFNENLSGSECQSNNTIQRVSKRAKGKRSKTSGSKESRRIGSRENLEQKNNKRSCQVFGIVTNSSP